MGFARKRRCAGVKSESHSLLSIRRYLPVEDYDTGQHRIRRCADADVLKC